MTASVRILSTSSMDSSPSILLISPDGSRILIDCGEGCQRSFLEYQQRLSTVKAVCITHLSVNEIGGLPGMILTSADIQAASSMASVVEAAQKKAGTLAAPTTTTTTNTSETARQQGAAPPPNRGGRRRRRRSAWPFLEPSSSDNDHEDNGYRNDDNESALQEKDLTLVGPMGMRSFLYSLRHFVRREKFHIHVHEGVVNDLEIFGKQSTSSVSNTNISKNRTQQSKKKPKSSRDALMNFSITSLVFVESSSTPFPTNSTTAAAGGASDTDIPSSGQKRPHTELEARNDTAPPLTSQTISYLFTTPPLPGKMQMEKAMALSIPKGPLLGQLKAGKSITFVDESGKEQRVESHQVVTPPSPGIGVVVLRYPISSSVSDTDNSDSNKNNRLERFFASLNLPELLRSKKNVELELILHLCTRSDFESPSAVVWRRSLVSAVNHGSDNSNDVKMQHVLVDTRPESDVDGSPRLAAAVLAERHAMLNNDIFLTLSSSSTMNHQTPVQESTVNNTDKHGDNSSRTNSGTEKKDGHVLARPTLEYTLIPRTKRGLVQQQEVDVRQQEIETALEFVNESGAKALAVRALSECGNVASSSGENESNGSIAKPTKGQLIFTGTASAIPCKYRNVTGMCLTDPFGRNMLLDIGEGTIGQLLRVQHHEHHDHTTQSLLSSIMAVWISHPHADHHLGILRLLEERQRVKQPTLATDQASNGNDKSIDPVIIIAPPPIFEFLREYASIVPSIVDSYHAIDCRDFLRNRMQNNTASLAKLRSSFQLTGCHSVQVQHCPFSYAVILEGTSFGTLVYSGDCRPSHDLAREAYGADVLIHESTFEDGMEAEAALKRHCTVGEALRIGQEMNAKCVVLTHFSQRYPKIPPTPAMLTNSGQKSSSSSSSSVPIIFAFDFMRLTPQNLLVASKLTPALRLLHPDESNDDDVNNEAVLEVGPSEAEVALSVPGLFAQSDLL